MTSPTKMKFDEGVQEETLKAVGSLDANNRQQSAAVQRRKK